MHVKYHLSFIPQVMFADAYWMGYVFLGPFLFHINSYLDSATCLDVVDKMEPP